MTSKKLVKNGVGNLNSKNSQQSTAQNQKDNSVFNGTTEYVAGTPFHVVKQETGWIIAMGKDVIKSGYNSKQAAKNAIYRKDWEIIHLSSYLFGKLMDEKMSAKEATEILKKRNENTEEYTDEQKEADIAMRKHLNDIANGKVTHG